MIRLRPEPLTEAAFAPFGQVIEARGEGRLVNGGTALRFDKRQGFAHGTASPLPSLAIYRSQPTPLPATVALLERHPRSSQSFVPMAARRWLVVVAHNPAEPQAFLARGDQGLTYGRGLWHSPLLALDHVTDFAMLMWETGTAGDTELLTLDSPLVLLEP